MAKAEGKVDLLERAHEAYQKRSESLSNLVRQLAFAGIAVIWVFRISTKDGSDLLRGELLPSMFFLVLALTLDMLHYVSATLIFAAWRRRHENDINPPSKFPRLINLPANICFWGKVISIGVAYSLLLWFLAQVLIDRSPS